MTLAPRGRHRWVTPAHVILMVALLAAVVGPAIAPLDPLAIPTGAHQHSLGPSWAHWLGTDPLGRDIASRLLAGARYTMGVSLGALVVATSLGLAVGGIACVMGPRGERMLLRVLDAAAAVPRVVVLIASAGVLGSPRAWPLVPLLGAVSWFELARLTHRSLRAQLVEDRVTAARAMGVPGWTLFRHHLLPDLTGLLWVWGSAQFGQLILAETGLSFLGLGVPAPYPSWGRVLLETGDVAGPARWLLLGPGLVVTLVVASAYSLADRASP